MELQKNSKTISEKIDKVDYEIHKYGHLNAYELKKLYFCKKLNKAMRFYEEEISDIMQHVVRTIQDKQILKELYKKEK